MNTLSLDSLLAHSPKAEQKGGSGRSGQSARFSAILNKLQKQETLALTQKRQPNVEDKAKVGVLKSVLPKKVKDQLGKNELTKNKDTSNWGMFKSQSAADLAGLNSPGSILLAKLEAMGSQQLNGLSLNENQLGDLQDILAQSGVDPNRIDTLLSSLASGQLSLDRVMMTVSQALSQAENLGLNENGLAVTEESLPALGQFFMSLGVSPEVAKTITSQLQVGDKLNSAVLKDIMGTSDDQSLLNPCISEAEGFNLKDLMQSLGANHQDLSNLANLMNKTNGELPLDSFLNFLDSAGQKTPTLTSDQIKQVEDLLTQTQAKQETAKILEFDKTMIMLNAMGDKELDKNFSELSPALQALRGGISNSKGEGGHTSSGGGGHNSGNKEEEKRESRHKLAPVDFVRHIDGKATNNIQNLNESFAGSGASETMARQIADKMIYSARQGVHRLQLNLNPEHLGQLNINLKVKGESLSAKIVADNPETKAALEKEIDGLKEALAAAGLAVDSLEISLAGDFQGGRGLKEPSVGNNTPDQKAKKEIEESSEPVIRNRYFENNTISRLV